jgi:flagellar motor switch protein FliG
LPFEDGVFDMVVNAGSLSVIKRAPDLRLLRKYEQKFGKVEHQFFGSISYLAPLLNAVFGEKMATKISDRIDGLVGVKRSAFKFVMVAEKKL